MGHKKVNLSLDEKTVERLTWLSERMLGSKNLSQTVRILALKAYRLENGDDDECNDN